MISGRSGAAAAIERYAGGGGASGQLLVEDVEDSCTGAELVALGAGAIHPAGTADRGRRRRRAPPPSCARRSDEQLDDDDAAAAGGAEGAAPRALSKLGRPRLAAAAAASFAAAEAGAATAGAAGAAVGAAVFSGGGRAPGRKMAFGE